MSGFIWRAFCFALIVFVPLRGLCQSSFPEVRSVAEKSELKAMYEEDQGDRVGPNALFGQKDKWPEMRKRDNARHERLKKLLAEGKVVSPEDKYCAAMILQHGSKTDDYLLAHVLAGSAAQNGFEKAKWLSAASLDRYLIKIGKPQIFGTQYQMENDQWTDEPLDSSLLSDTLRADYNVPSLADSKKIMEELRAKGIEQKK